MASPVIFIHCNALFAHFGHQMELLAPGGSTCISCKLGPQLHILYFRPKQISKSEEGSCRGVISRSQWQLFWKAHKVILAAPSLMFPKRNRHPHPLIYVWGLNFNPSYIDQWMRMSVSVGKHLNLKSTQGASHFFVENVLLHKLQEWLMGFGSKVLHFSLCLSKLNLVLVL